MKLFLSHRLLVFLNLLIYCIHGVLLELNRSSCTVSIGVPFFLFFGRRLFTLEVLQFHVFFYSNEIGTVFVHVSIILINWTKLHDFWSALALFVCYDYQGCCGLWFFLALKKSWKFEFCYGKNPKTINLDLKLCGDFWVGTINSKSLFLKIYLSSLM